MPSKSKSISWDSSLKAIVKTGVSSSLILKTLFQFECLVEENVAGSDEGGVLWPEPGGGAEPHSCAPAGAGGPLLSGGASSFYNNIDLAKSGPTFGDFVSIRTEASTQDVTVARLQSTRVQTPRSPLF
jgi:hypothetical protein